MKNKTKYNFNSCPLSSLSLISLNPEVLQVLPYEKDVQFTMLVKNYWCFNQERKGVWLKK